MLEVQLISSHVVPASMNPVETEVPAVYGGLAKRRNDK